MKPMTQAQLSQATSKARQWFERNSRRYAPDDVQLFDRLIPLVEKPLHLHALSEEMKRRMLPEKQGRAATSHAGASLGPISPTSRIHAMSPQRAQAPCRRLPNVQMAPGGCLEGYRDCHPRNYSPPISEAQLSPIVSFPETHLEPTVSAGGSARFRQRDNRIQLTPNYGENSNQTQKGEPRETPQENRTPGNRSLSGASRCRM